MENIETVLTKEEITRARTVDELINWLNDKFDELKNIDGGKEAIRMRKGFCKELVEEVYPLGILASHRYLKDPNIILQPVIEDQEYDALIIDKSKEPQIIQKLEITQAHEGENQFLRRLMLHEQGHAPATGPIKKLEPRILEYLIKLIRKLEK